MNIDYTGAAYTPEEIKKCQLTQTDLNQPFNKRQNGRL
jgi:hypothetical protein